MKNTAEINKRRNFSVKDVLELQRRADRAGKSREISEIYAMCR